MSGSSISTFQGADGFLAALTQAGYQSLLVVEPGQFSASITNIQLHQMRLSWVAEQLSRIAFRSLTPGMIRVVLPVRLGSLSCGGMTIGDGQFLMHGSGLSLHERTVGAVEWRDILIPSHHLMALTRALTGEPRTIPSEAQLWRAPGKLLRKLNALHEAATHLTEKRPRAPHSIQAAHGLEQELIGLLVECVSAGSVEIAHTSVKRSIEVVGAFENLLLSQAGRPLALPQVCQKLGICERSLRACFHRQLGIGPARYLRLHQAKIVDRAYSRLE